MKRLRVCDIVRTMHDACSSGTWRVFIVVRLQRLKMKALIPSSADCVVRSVIKVLNAQSIIPVEIRQLCHVYGHTWLDSQHNSCRSLIIIHPIVWTSLPMISIFSYTSRNSCPVSVSIFRMTERRRWVPQWFQSQVGDFYNTGIQTLVARYDKCLNSGGEYVEKYLNSCCICSNTYNLVLFL